MFRSLFLIETITNPEVSLRPDSVSGTVRKVSESQKKSEGSLSVAFAVADAVAVPVPDHVMV